MGFSHGLHCRRSKSFHCWLRQWFEVRDYLNASEAKEANDDCGQNYHHFIILIHKDDGDSEPQNSFVDLPHNLRICIYNENSMCE